MAGALQLVELESILTGLGFQAVRELRRYDPFRGTSVESTARKYGVYGADLFATLG